MYGEFVIDYRHVALTWTAFTDGNLKISKACEILIKVRLGDCESRIAIV